MRSCWRKHRPQSARMKSLMSTLFGPPSAASARQRPMPDGESIGRVEQGIFRTGWVNGAQAPADPCRSPGDGVSPDFPLTREMQLGVCAFHPDPGIAAANAVLQSVRNRPAQGPAGRRVHQGRVLTAEQRHAAVRYGERNHQPGPRCRPLLWIGLGRGPQKPEKRVYPRPKSGLGQPTPRTLPPTSYQRGPCT